MLEIKATEDKEHEIRLQFLEEATEYLNTIELVLNGSAGFRLDEKGIDTVTRAAHSIKGGAAMVGLSTLNDMSLRLEDFFKVFRTQPQRPVEPELEGLLLAIVDRMREIVSLNFEGADADKQWLDRFVNPGFHNLQKFSSSTTTSEAPVALPENEQDIVKLIFQTEVEECLQHLESVLADQKKSSFLLEESMAAAQALGGLGEMLNLTEFSSLCESITQQLEANPTQVEEIARLALQEWRRSQAALLVGQPDAQPSPTTEHNAITSPNDIQFDTINLYDPSEPNRTYLTSLEHKLGCEGIVCIPSEQLQQINLVFGKLTEQHQRNAEQLQLNAAYLEQLGSLLEKLNHDTHSQLTHSHKVPLGFSNGVGDLELEEKPSAIAAIASQKNTILIVDDSKTVRQSLSLTLEKAGYRVESAEDGLDALKQLLSGLQVGAIICDLDMPHLDGYGLLTRLKSDPTLKHFPIAMLTSHVENERRQKAMLLGAAAYFTKPYNAQELLRTLKELIK